jgi:hypothetical protein
MRRAGAPPPRTPLGCAGRGRPGTRPAAPVDERSLPAQQTLLEFKGYAPARIARLYHAAQAPPRPEGGGRRRRSLRSGHCARVNKSCVPGGGFGPRMSFVGGGVLCLLSAFRSRFLPSSGPWGWGWRSPSRRCAPLGSRPRGLAAVASASPPPCGGGSSGSSRRWPSAPRGGCGLSVPCVPSSSGGVCGLRCPAGGGCRRAGSAGSCGGWSADWRKLTQMQARHGVFSGRAMV